MNRLIFVFAVGFATVAGQAKAIEPNPREELIASWAKKSGFKVLDITLRPASGPVSVTLDGARVQYEKKISGKCVTGFRDVVFAEEKGSLKLQEDNILAENCCALEKCSERTPGGWFLELFAAVDDRSRLLKLIDPKKGVRITARGSEKKLSYQQLKKGAEFPNLSFNPLYDFISCSDSFSVNFRCDMTAGGEASHFVFEGTAQKAYLIEMGFDHE